MLFTCFLIFDQQLCLILDDSFSLFHTHIKAVFPCCTGVHVCNYLKEGHCRYTPTFLFIYFSMLYLISILPSWLLSLPRLLVPPTYLTVTKGITVAVYSFSRFYNHRRPSSINGDSTSPPSLHSMPQPSKYPEEAPATLRSRASQSPRR